MHGIHWAASPFKLDAHFRQNVPLISDIQRIFLPQGATLASEPIVER